MIAGRYSLEREIGRGGAGVVWLGRDELLGRQVALKQIGLLPGTDGTDLARAEREARLSAQLHHPHVVTVFDVVEDDETGGHWLVMEYVDGPDLGQFVRTEGRLSPDAAAPLLRQASEALLAAHAAGIVHRDVKPSNILLDNDRQVKLTDFGIARVNTDPSLTRTGLVTGSPAYLAPEVATGARGDEAADVWSLGATAFHVLAGRPPYDVGDNVLGAMYRIVNDAPPRLPEAGWMAPLLEGTMVRDPARRWTMQQVRDFLSGHDRPAATTAETLVAPGPPADGEGTRPLTAVAAVPPPLVEEPPAAAAPSPRRRPPTQVLVGVVLVVALLLAAVAYAALSGGGSGSGDKTAASAGKSSSPRATAKPTAAGMESFIRDYVTTVADDPDSAWTMLTPKFQRESGGLDHYRQFWDSATNGRVLSISADPADLTVSYQVRFDNFHNGPGPTVLDLKFENGHYLIDGEHSKGFVPAG